MSQPQPPKKPVLVSTVPDDVVLIDGSKWTTSDYRRLFIVTDPWHGMREKTRILEVQKNEELYRDTAELLALIKNGKLLLLEL